MVHFFMTSKFPLKTVLQVTFFVTVLLFVLDALTSFDIKNQTLKTLTYFGFVTLSPFTLIYNLTVIKTIKERIVYSILPLGSIVAILIIGPMTITRASASWSTQTVIYQSDKFGFNQVEFQMQDVGALGYNRRTVQVMYLTDLFIITKPIDTDIETSSGWIKVDIHVNELDLKLP